MEKPSFKLVGSPCGQHGQYTFYKAIRLTGERERIVAIGDFFFVRIWQDSELVSIGELQLLWTDRVSDQTLVSLRLYFLPENTPDGRSQHGEDEVLAINDKVVVRAEDLLSWLCDGANWRWGLRAVWRGACAPPADPRHTAPLHHTKLDFSDVEREKSTLAVDAESPGVVVFSYPRYCRYRALLARLEGIQADWLRDSLVAALGGYAAPTKNTSILYCKETFEYPELEGHEFVCNHLAPRLKGRPRGRRRRAPRSRSRSRSDKSSDSDVPSAPPRPRTDPMTPRRLSLRNGAPPHDEPARVARPARPATGTPPPPSADDKAFLLHLRHFYTLRNLHLNTQHTLKHLSLRNLYNLVVSRGGYEAVCRHKLWRALSDQPARTRAHYERFLLPYENHERRNGTFKINGKVDEPHTIATIDVTESPLRDVEHKPDIHEKILRTPSPKHEKFIDNETGEIKEELNVISKPAEELNREFLDSLPKEDEKFKITVKPVEKLIEPKTVRMFEENSALISELVIKHNMSESSKVIPELGSKQMSRDSSVFLNELAQKLDLGNSDTTLTKDAAPSDSAPAAITITEKSLNGHDQVPLPTGQQKSRPAGRSSLRAVRVKPTRAPHTHTHTHTHSHTHSHPHPHSHSAPPSTPPVTPLRPDSASSSPPVPTVPPPPPASAPPLNNFGIHHPPLVRSSSAMSDDEIVEVPYKPKTPEIIDLDEYPESPQSVKKKKLDILKERGLEVTALPTTNWTQPQLNPIPPMILNPAMQHQIMTQAQLFQMYNIIPQNYSNGIQPPKVIQGTSIFGSAGPEKTVYGNPKDPFMPPPHILHGTPVKTQRNAPQSTNPPPHDILDLTCRDASPHMPAVEIVKVPNSPSPSKTAQNLSKNYTLLEGKAVVGSNLEITLVNKVQTPTKNRPPQKRSSNGKFMSTKTPTPPKDYPKLYACPSPSGVHKKPQIVVPNYQITREDVSPTSSTGSTTSQGNLLPSNIAPNAYKSNLAQIMEMQKTAAPMTSFMDPYMALYSSLAGQMDQRQLAVYRDLMANQFRGYSGLLNLGAVASTPTTKN